MRYRLMRATGRKAEAILVDVSDETARRRRRGGRFRKSQRGKKLFSCLRIFRIVRGKAERRRGEKSLHVKISPPKSWRLFVLREGAAARLAPAAAAPEGHSFESCEQGRREKLSLRVA